MHRAFRLENHHWVKRGWIGFIVQTSRASWPSPLVHLEAMLVAQAMLNGDPDGLGETSELGRLHVLLSLWARISADATEPAGWDLTTIDE
jgi:hypothetical protein